jgi:hypothetical protein
MLMRLSLFFGVLFLFCGPLSTNPATVVMEVSTFIVLGSVVVTPGLDAHELNLVWLAKTILTLFLH